MGVLVVVALLLWNPWRSNLDGAAQPEPSASAIPSPAVETPAATPAPAEPAATTPPAEEAEPVPPATEQGPAETVSTITRCFPVISMPPGR